MIVKVVELVKAVRTAIDMNMGDKPLIAESDQDTLTLDEIINSKIVEGTKRVLMEAPLFLIEGEVPFGDAIYWNDNCSGWTILPCDFMRLVVFRMSDWERPVYEAITPADPKYSMQSSSWKGVRGNPQKPVAALVKRQEGLVLELYSCNDKSATVSQALYLPVPKIDKDGGIEIPEKCYESVVYRIAELTLATLGERELSSTMNELSKQLLET